MMVLWSWLVFYGPFLLGQVLTPVVYGVYIPKQSAVQKPSFLTDNMEKYVPVGGSVYLPCRVKDLGKHTVRWSARKTIFKGEKKFIVDRKRRVMLLRKTPRDWSLCIRDINVKDREVYECEIDTTPPISREIELEVGSPKCDDDQFPCRISKCVNRSQQCDGKWDCGDGVDELCCDDCEGVKCQNGGTNVPSVDINMCCHCPDGFTGITCEKCDPDIIICRNGTLTEFPINGTCSCLCTEGFSGKFCQLSGDYIELPKGDQCSVSKLDVVFALDNSRGLEDVMFEFLKSFMDIKCSGTGTMHVGLVTIENNVHQQLKPYVSYDNFISSLRRKTFYISDKKGVQLSVGKMISYAGSMFSTSGNRKKVPDLVVLTINDNWNLSSAIGEVRQLIEDDDHVMVVTPKSTPEVLKMTSHPDAVFITGPFTEFSPFDAAQQAVLSICTACDRDWIHIGDSCYRLFDRNDVASDSNGIKWTTAETKCRSMKTKLISINTDEEGSNVLTQLLPGFTGLVHIGLQRDKGTINPMYKSMFRWLDGTPPVYTIWSSDKSCWNSSEDDDMVFFSVKKCAAWKLNPNCSGWINVGCAHPIGDAFICEDVSRARNYTAPSEVPLMTPPEAKIPSRDFLVGNRLFVCQSGDIIPLSARCDNRFDCTSHDDEFNCTGCDSPNTFKCGDGSCISIGLYCNFIKDCPGGEDEHCVYTSCTEDQWRCENKECISRRRRCDFTYNCIDQSDEKGCETDVKNSFRCYDGSYLPRQWRCDGIVDCPGPDHEDETSCEKLYSDEYIQCDKRRRQTFKAWDGCDGKNDCENGWDESEEGCREALKVKCSWNYPMRFLRKKYLYTRYVRNLGNTDCSNVTCRGNTEFKCPGSFCIQSFMVCNGVMDCPDGEDEAHCDTAACRGLYHCSNTTACIPSSWFQDHIIDCPLHDDESYHTRVCDAAAGNCTCSDASITCSDSYFKEYVFHKETRKINFSNIEFRENEIGVKGLHYLAELILTNCSLKVIPSLLDLWNLLLLDLSHNEISVLEEDIFDDLGKLRLLYLNDNSGLQYLQPGCCDSLVSLEVLNIDRTGVTELNEKTFKGLSKIKSLSVAYAKISVIESGAFNLESLERLILTGNPHINFDSGVYDGASNLERLETSNFYLCCEEVRPESLEEDNCKAPNYGLSSCTDLLQSNGLRLSIYVLSLAALLGNSGSLCYRVIYDKASLSRGYGVFVSNLSVSDLIMGIYMLIIAVADRSYRDEYMWKDFDWRHSWVCQMAGFLSTLSCETSMMFICLITLDRFLVIKYPFGNFKFKRNSAIAASLAVWLVCLLLAGIPLLPSFAHWMLYSKSSVCLALPLVDLDSDGQTFSFTVFIGLNFVVFAFIATGQTAIYMSMRSGDIRKGKNRRAQDMAVARKLSLVVITDFICWFPICVMGIMAATGTDIPHDTYAWTAVFVLPVNSALNPFLYTFLSAIQRKVRQLTHASSKGSTSHREESETSSSLGTKVTVGFPDSRLVSLRTYMDTDVDSMSDLVKCLGHVISALPKLQLCQKNHQQLTTDNIFVRIKGRGVEQICFGVEEDQKRAIEEDVVAITDIMKKWADEHPQSSDDESKFGDEL